MSVSPLDLTEYLHHVGAGDAASAVGVALRLADEGEPLPRLLSDLVGAAQTEVGDRWHRNEYTVADEHAATAVADAVVSILSAGETPEDGAAHVVVTCAEGEWHVLAARLAAEVFRAEGFRVTFLGPSMPAAHLGAFLERVSPDAVAISCSTPLAFNGVVACVEAAHQAGVPVLLGGRALGGSVRRAEILGADIPSLTADAAIRALRRPLAVVRPSTAEVGGALEIARQREAIVAGAMAEFSCRFPRFAAYTDTQQARTREDFTYMLQFVEAAVLVRDRAVFDDFIIWLETLLAARGLARSVLDLSLGSLGVAASQVPAVVDLLSDAMV